MLIKQKLKIYEKQKMEAISKTYDSGKGQQKDRDIKDREMNQKMNKLEWMM